jgi:hypothetical protein
VSPQKINYLCKENGFFVDESELFEIQMTRASWLKIPAVRIICSYGIPRCDVIILLGQKF